MTFSDSEKTPKAIYFECKVELRKCFDLETRKLIFEKINKVKVTLEHVDFECIALNKLESNLKTAINYVYQNFH